MKVPDILLSGNHAKIEQWREEESLKRTFERRPDLFENYPLTDKQKLYIEKLKNNNKDA